MTEDSQFCMLFVTLFFAVMFEIFVLFHITTRRNDRSGKRDLSVLSGFWATTQVSHNSCRTLVRDNMVPRCADSQAVCNTFQF